MELTAPVRVQPRTWSWPFVLFIAVMIHVDWHLARPGHMGMAWSNHWVFAMAFFFVAGRWAASRWRGSPMIIPILNVAAGLVLAQGIEPLLEQAYYFHSFGYNVDAARWRVFLLSVAIGLPSFLLTYRLQWQRFQPRKPPRKPTSH